jgi:hypothetical protein
MKVELTAVAHERALHVDLSHNAHAICGTLTRYVTRCVRSTTEADQNKFALPRLHPVLSDVFSHSLKRDRITLTEE